MEHRNRTLAAAALIVLLAAGLPAARADDPPKAPATPAKPAENVSEEAAKAAVERFRKDYANEDTDVRLDAVKALGRVLHPSVATVLLEVGLSDADGILRIHAFRALAGQTTAAKVVGPRMAAFLLAEAKDSQKRKARGDYGLRVDPKTGDIDTTSEEGKAAQREKRERGAMLAEAVRVLDGLGWKGKDAVECLSEFLTDGNDDLVAVVLGMFGKWKEWSVLKPELLELFEMYPEEDKFETGSTSVDTGAAGSADQQAAKRKWMAKYGDPDRRRPRPKLVRALKQALLDITGEKIESPQALRDFLKRPDVKRKVK